MLKHPSETQLQMHREARLCDMLCMDVPLMIAGLITLIGRRKREKIINLKPTQSAYGGLKTTSGYKLRLRQDYDSGSLKTSMSLVGSNQSKEIVWWPKDNLGQ